MYRCCHGEQTISNAVRGEVFIAFSRVVSRSRSSVGMDGSNETKRRIFRNFERKCVFKNRRNVCVYASLLHKVTQFFDIYYNIRNRNQQDKVFRNSPVSSSFDRVRLETASSDTFGFQSNSIILDRSRYISVLYTVVTIIFRLKALKGKYYE